LVLNAVQLTESLQMALASEAQAFQHDPSKAAPEHNLHHLSNVVPSAASNRSPQNAGEIAIGNRKCATDNDDGSTQVQVGAKEQSGDSANWSAINATGCFLRFAFLAIGEQTAKKSARFVLGIIKNDSG
jgi:hypothetical protein